MNSTTPIRYNKFTCAFVSILDYLDIHFVSFSFFKSPSLEKSRDDNSN